MRTVQLPNPPSAVLRNGRLLQLVENAAAAASGGGRSPEPRRPRRGVAGAVRAGGAPSKIERAGARMLGKQRQQDAGGEKGRGEPGRRARQQVRRAAPGEKAAATAAADAQRAAFRTLQQHDGHQRRGDHQMENEKGGRHGNLLQLEGMPGTGFGGVLYADRAAGLGGPKTGVPVGSAALAACPGSAERVDVAGAT